MNRGMKWYQSLSMVLLIAVLWVFWLGYVKSQTENTTSVISGTAAVLFVTLFGVRSLIDKALELDPSLEVAIGIMITLFSIITAFILAYLSNRQESYEIDLLFDIACTMTLLGAGLIVRRKFISE